MLNWVQTTRDRARTWAGGCGSFVCGRAHEPRAPAAPTVVGTSKGCWQCFGRGYVQLGIRAAQLNRSALDGDTCSLVESQCFGRGYVQFS